MDELVELEDRQEHCKNDAHDEEAHRHDHERAEEADERGKQTIELALLADARSAPAWLRARRSTRRSR